MASLRPFRDGLIAGLATFVVTSLCLTVLFVEGRRALEGEVRGDLIRTATTVAALVDGDLHRTFTRPEQETSPEYRQAVAPLRKVQGSRKDIRFVYTMVLRDDRPRIVLDATPPGDPNHSPIMQPYDVPAPELMDALRTGKAQADTDPIKDQWGSYLSGYAPFFDSAGRMVGVVGVDLPGGEYVARLASIRRAFAVGLALAVLVCVLVGLIVWLLRRHAVGIERDRRRAVEALMRDEANYRSLMENTPDIMIRLDSEGRYLYVSSAVANYSTRKPEEYLGRTLRELGSPARVCELWERQIRTVLETREPAEQEYEVNIPAGRVIINWRLFPECDAAHRIVSLFGIGRDITEHRKAERDYRMIFESMIDGFALHEIICDSDGKPVDYRFLAMNPAFERLTGLKAADLVGRTVMEVLPGLESSWIDIYGGVALTGQPAHFENYSQPLDRWFEVTAYRPQVQQFACIFVDITARKRAEIERQQMEEQLQHVQKLESLGVLAGGIAHDFNNLLMAILGNADLALADMPAGMAVREHLDQIKTTSLRAAELCNQMLAYSGRGRFVIQPLDVSGLVKEMAHLLEVSVSKRVLLRCDLAPGLPSIEADATQIRQVVMNLVMNGSEAIGEQSGAISVTTGVMECDQSCLSKAYFSESRTPGRYVYVAVADTGCGMDDATLARVFEPFFTTKFTGRGLGLAVVLGIVRGHKGAIKVHSESGHGTTFTVLFPVSKETAVAGTTSAAAPVWHGVGTVLLVDDDESVRLVATRMIERGGFEVVTAADGREALAVYARHAAEIVCVIVDLTMPNMDGEETFRELRRLNPDVNVILSSGYNQQDVANRFAGKGLAGFLQKPYQLAQLRGALDAVVNGAGLGRS